MVPGGWVCHVREGCLKKTVGRFYERMLFKRVNSSVRMRDVSGQRRSMCYYCCIICFVAKVTDINYRSKVEVAGKSFKVVSNHHTTQLARQARKG